MFPFRTPRRRRTASSLRSRPDRRSLTRLAVESMEGRLMLSTTALEFEPFELQAVAFAGLYGTADEPATETVSMPQLPDEGGAIRLYLPPRGNTWYNTVPRFTGMLVAGTADTHLSRHLVDYISPRVPNLVFEIEMAPWTLDGTGLDHDGLSGSGIQGISFQESSFVLNGKALTNDGVAEDSQSFASTASEGGQISIPAILAKNELELAPKLDPVQEIRSVAAQVAPSVAEQGVRNADEPSPLTATASNEHAVTAEWARAMVLETAGGEPDIGSRFSEHEDSRLNTPSQGRRLPYADGPVSSRSDDSAEHKVSHTSATAPAYGAAPMNADHAAEPSTQSSGWREAMQEGAGSISRAIAATRGTTHFALSFMAVGGGAAMGHIGAANDLPGSALDAAFDEMGGESPSDAPRVADDWLSRSLGAAPVLMVLALERIAASNSRRNRRDAGPVAIRRLKTGRRAATE